MNAILIYASRYGSTKAYAQLIGQALDLAPMSTEFLKAEDVTSADLVIYGSPLLAGSLKDTHLLEKLTRQSLYIFSVGLMPPDEIKRDDVLDRNVPQHLVNKANYYHFLGRLDFDRLSLIHKVMMAYAKRAWFDKVPKDQWSPQRARMMKDYYHAYDFSDPRYIEPLVADVQREIARHDSLA